MHLPVAVSISKKKEREGEVTALVALDMVSFNLLGLWPFSVGENRSGNV